MPIPQFGLRQLAALINQQVLKTPVERELGRLGDENIEGCFNRPTSGAQQTLARRKMSIIRWIARRIFQPETPHQQISKYCAIGSEADGGYVSVPAWLVPVAGQTDVKAMNLLQTFPGNRAKTGKKPSHVKAGKDVKCLQGYASKHSTGRRLFRFVSLAQRPNKKESTCGSVKYRLVTG